MEPQHEQQYLRLALRFIEPVSEPGETPVPSRLPDGMHPTLYSTLGVDGLTLWRSLRALQM